jgi:hypothetical protein
MIPVFQTNTSPIDGNCFQACVASIFELSLDEVPHFCKKVEGDQWWYDFRDWLSDKNYSCANEKISEENGKEWLDWLNAIDCYGIGSIKSGNLYHAVVVKGSKIIHNPWPSYNGNNDEDLVDVTLFLVKNPIFN